MKFRIVTLGIVCILLLPGANGQTINSPYSDNGLGEFNPQGLIHNYAMGETGIAMPTVWHINLMNPALLINNTFSTFQVGIGTDFRRYESNIGTDSENAASLRSMAMSFPVVRRRWTSSFALLPLSSVKYNTYSTDTLDASVVAVNLRQGDGGLSQLVWTNGFRIYKTLSIGFKASYIFGSIDRETRVQLLSDEFIPSYSISYFESTTYSDVNFSLGVAYRLGLGANRFLNLGAVYDLSGTLEGKEDRYYERQRLNGTAVQRQAISSDQNVSFTLPRTFGFGVSYEALNVFKVGVDISHKTWGNTSNESTVYELRNVAEMGVGAEWVPDNQSVTSYLKRVLYRFGVNYKQLPYQVNNTDINDFGINFGASFPVSGYSSMDAAFKVGLRGTTDNNLIRENYFQIVIGATINDNQWFIKRRYD